MSVRKRVWKTKTGKKREAWVVDYFDAKNIRCLKTYAKKKDADKAAQQTGVDVRAGIHVADRDSITIGQAARHWLTDVESDTENPIQRSTYDQYAQHVDIHIMPLIGLTKLKDADVPFVEGFTRLLAKGDAEKKIKPRSPAMVRKIRTTLGAIFAWAQRNKRATSNPVRDVKQRRSRRKPGGERLGYRLRIGVDIPTPEEASKFISALEGSWRPILLTTILTGLRASELRGLRWEDVNLDKKPTIQVTQRADCYNEIGNTKSEAGERTVPLPPQVANTLRKWKLKCPKGDLGLAFPNGAGNIESHANIVNRGLHPAMIRAGVVVPVLDVKGKPVMGEDGEAVVKPKYTGLHALRHFYASWCINRRADGGLELPPKNVQKRLGHSTIQMTLDTYGHLFPAGDEGAELEAGERALMALGK